MKLFKYINPRLRRRMCSALLSVLLVVGMIPFGVSTINAEDNVTTVDVSTFNELNSNNKTNYVLNLTDDIVFTSRINLADGVVINGNGHTVSVLAPALSDEGILNSSASKYGIFYIYSGRKAAINNVHFKGGNAWNIENRGTITLDNVSITNCQYIPFFSNGVAVLKNCDISRNYATNCGAVYSERGSLVMDNCSVTQNRITSWGAIGGNNTDAFINNTVVANNHSTDVAGLLFRGSSDNRKTVCIINSTFTGNYSTGNWGSFSAGNYADFYGVNNVIQDNFCSKYPARSNTFIESDNASLTLNNCLTTASTTSQPSGSFYRYTTFGNVDLTGVESTYSWPHVLLLENSGVKYAPLSANSDALSGGVKTYFDYTLEGTTLTANMSYDMDGVNTPLGGLTASETKVEKYIEGSSRADGVIGASGTGSGTYYTTRISGGTNSADNKLKYVEAKGVSVYGDVHVEGDTPEVVLDPTGYIVNGLENLTENTDYRDLSGSGDGDVKTYEIIGNRDTIIVPDYTLIPDVTVINYPVTVEDSDEYTGNYTLTTDNFTSGDLIPYDNNVKVTITVDDGYCVAGFDGIPDTTYTSAYSNGTTAFTFNIRKAEVIKPVIAKLDDINTSDKLYGAAKYKNITIEITSDITVDKEIALSDGVVIRGNGHTVKVPVTGLNDSGVTNANPSAWSVFTLQKYNIGVSISDMTIEGGSARAINSSSSGLKNRLTLENVKVTKVCADYAVFFEDVSFVFKNCVFTLNRCEEYVLRKRGDTAVIDGCSFVKNYGGVYVTNSGVEFINNTNITGNFDTRGSYYSQALMCISSNTAMYLSNVNVVGNETDRSLYVGWSNWVGRAYAVNCVFADNFGVDRNNKVFPAAIRLANENTSAEFYNCLVNVGFSSHQDASLTVNNCKTDTEEGETAFMYRKYNRLIAADGTPSGIRLPLAVVLTENQTIPYTPLAHDADALSGGIKTYFDYTVSERTVTARLSYDNGGVNTLLGRQTEISDTEVTTFVNGEERPSGVYGSSGTDDGVYYTTRLAGPSSCGVSGATVFGDAYAVDSPNHVAITPGDEGDSIPLEFVLDNKYITGFSNIDESKYTASGDTYTFTPDESTDVVPLFNGDLNDVDTYEKLSKVVSIPGANIELTNDIETGGLITVAEDVTINGNGHTVKVPVTGLNDAGVYNDNPSEYGVFYIPSGKSLKLKDMTVEGGATTAITSKGLLIMEDVTVQKANLTVNNVLGNNCGGGLDCRYITILKNCSIRRNVSKSHGGGIYAPNATNAAMIIDGCSVTDNTAYNHGGGYYGTQPTHMNNSLFANNRAANYGAFDSYWPDIMNCTFVGNSSNSTKAFGARGMSAVNCVFADNVISSYTSDAVTKNSDLTFYKTWGDYDVLINCAYGGTVNSDDRTTETNCKNVNPGNTLLSYFDNISRDFNHFNGKEGKGHYDHASLFKVDGRKTYYSPLSPLADVLTGGTKTYFNYKIKGTALTVKMSYMNDEGEITAFGGNTAADASHEVTDYLEGGERQPGVIGASGTGSGTYHTIRLTGGRNALGNYRGASIFGETYESGSTVSVSEKTNSGAELKFKDATDEGNYFNPTRNPDNSYTFTMDRDYAVIPALSSTYNVTNYNQLTEYGALPNSTLNIMNDITVSDAVALADGVIINGNGYTITVNTTGLDDVGAVNSDASKHGVFTIAADNSAEIYNLDIYGGSVSAICNQGVLLMENVDISKSYSGYNNAANTTQGGAIYSNKTLILKNCSLSGNASWSNGGAVCAGGIMTADNCSFTDNRTLASNTNGGAIYKMNVGSVSESTNALYLNNCTIANNSATYRGGGICNLRSVLYAADCTIAGNAGTANAGHGLDNIYSNRCYLVNTIIADNFYVNNSVRETRDLSGSNINLYNCVYGYTSTALATESNCKSAEYSQQNGSCGIFADYKESSILNYAAVEIYKTYPRPVLDETSSGLMFAPLSTGSLPMTGGTKTYYSFSQAIITARMSYDVDGTNTALGNLSASTALNDHYLEGGARDYGVIGTSYEIDVYYKPRASLTIKQSIDGELEDDTLAQVTVTNINDSAPPEPYSAFVDEDDNSLDSVIITDTKDNVTEYDENVPGALSRTTKLGMHKGVTPQIKIKPYGSRNISSVKIQKKSGKTYTAVPASSYTVTGSLVADGYVTYTFNNGVNIGDDYVVRIVYGVGKTFTVKAVMLDADGKEEDVDTEEEFNESKATVTVNAVRYDADGNAIDGEYAFTDRTVSPSVDKNSFTVTYNPTTVSTATNTRVTVNTTIEDGSEYVIADVKAVKDSGDDLHLVTPRTVAHDSNIGTSYDECTLSSLASTDNVTLIVYLAKMVSYNVSVYNISDTGEVINGVPAGGDAYVNVNVKSSVVNERAIITDASEGGYYTNNFDITINPHSRHVSVIRGTKLEIFAQLPGSGEYIIKKVTGSGYSDLSVSHISVAKGNLRETLSTGEEAISASGAYDVKIYIERASSIYTRAVTNKNGTYSAANGTVTVNGSYNESGVLPFTKIYPAAGNAESMQTYNAVLKSGSYTTEAKCVKGSSLSFDVTPEDYYIIKSVTVKKGAVKESAEDIAFTASEPTDDGKVSYTITDPMPQSNNLFIDVEFEPDPDLITIYNNIKGNGSGSINGYLFYVDDPEDINLDNDESTYAPLGSQTRFGADLKGKTSVYYVLETGLSAEKLPIIGAEFYNDIEGESDNILSELNLTYMHRTNSTGKTQYYYYYKVNPDDANPILTSKKFDIRVDCVINYEPDESNPDCNITVEQWNRETYDGRYVAADNQSARFSVPSGSVLKKNNKTGASANPITVSSSLGYMYSVKKTVLSILPIPAEGYNVEKVVIDDGVEHEISGSSGIYRYTLKSNSVSVKLYYSRPLLILSSTNEGNEGKATVNIGSDMILNRNTFINGTFVTKNENSVVTINPLTYDDDGVTKYYKIASIRIGDAFNNTFTVYSESAGDVENDDYTVLKNASGSEYTLTLNNVQKDKYIFIQLIGKERIYQSNLQVNQKIRLAGSDEYIDCTDGYYGSVTVNGTLAGNEHPLNFGSDVSSYTFNNSASVTGTVIKDTILSLEASAPSGYMVQKVEANINGESVTVAKNGNIYSLINKAPDSGSTELTVYYVQEKLEFNLNYRYYSREWNADEESSFENNSKVIGENTTPDKTYTVTVELTKNQVENGKPKSSVLVANAPAVDDLYKDCKWQIDENHVSCSGSEVTVTATQPPKTFTVKFFNQDGEFKKIEQVKLNRFVKENDEFIKADETLNGSKFAYWLVEDENTGREIAKCFSPEFNLRVTANIKVTAYYGATAKSITISDPKLTREQSTDGENPIDKIYADFILSYMEDEGRLFNSSIAEAEQAEVLEGYSSGLIVEFDSNIKLSREDERGHKLSDEEKVVFPANDTVDRNTIISYIKDKNPTLPNTRTLINLPVNNSSYNNKNRVDKTIDFSNTENARHTVLRAYYYVKDAEGNVELTDPVYFYLYDIGNSAAEE